MQNTSQSESEAKMSGPKPKLGWGERTICNVLPGKSGDLNLIQEHRERRPWPLGLSTCQSSLIGKLLVRKRPRFMKQSSHRKRSKVLLWPTHTYTHMYMCAYTRANVRLHTFANTQKSSQDPSGQFFSCLRFWNYMEGRFFKNRTWQPTYPVSTGHWSLHTVRHGTLQIRKFATVIKK